MTDAVALLHATWPPAASRRCGPFTLRTGAGGGKRVSAATSSGAPTDAEITAAERAMDAAGERALFALTPDQADLDGRLARRGYLVLDPTLALSCPVERLSEPPPTTGFFVWPPLQVVRDIWSEARIGPERVAVMERVAGAKTAILGRVDDAPAGAAFVARHDDAAMVHAMAVRPAHRRKGLARHMMHHAALWTRARGAREIVVLVTEANEAATALYASLGMVGTRCYHYRFRP